MKIACVKSSILFLFLISVSLFAQTPSEKISDIIGKRVRIFAPQITDDWMKGKVEDISNDTLKLSMIPQVMSKNISVDAIKLLEVDASTTKSRLKSGMIGGFLGAAFGASAGFIIWGVKYGSDHYNTDDFQYQLAPSRTSYVTTSTLIGAVVGLLIGAASTEANEKWEKYPIEALPKE